MTGPVPAWTYVVEPPGDGWVWLPSDEDVAAWAQGVCADLGVAGPAEPELAAELRHLAVGFRERDHDSVALWLPDPAHGVLATLTTDRYALPEPLADVAEQLRAEAGPGLPPPDVRLVELPAGPAVRSRQVRRAGPSPAGDRLVESVAHLVAPPGVVDSDTRPTAVDLVVTWERLDEGDEFALLADDAAERLRVVHG